ncbi:MAG: FKBP-type peptidyl-prolyl cis-trans isomerase, partial [Muribaculaceae bacterium]|nr:FKBP-type peptidyl-prolyl cis-trans isomerase [Muribaculaceae bacterium]
MEEKKIDRLSYALGLSMGNNFRASGVETIDAEDFTAGLKAVYDGTKPLISYDEAKEEIRRYFMELEAKKQKADQANAELGKAYLAENAKREEVKVTPSGLQYEVIAEGEGESPKATDMVTVHYTGTLIDGTVFDSSVERGEPATFGVNQVIPGWVEA